MTYIHSKEELSSVLKIYYGEMREDIDYEQGYFDELCERFFETIATYSYLINELLHNQSFIDVSNANGMTHDIDIYKYKDLLIYRNKENIKHFIYNTERFSLLKIGETIINFIDNK